MVLVAGLVGFVVVVLMMGDVPTVESSASMYVIFFPLLGEQGAVSSCVWVGMIV